MANFVVEETYSDAIEMLTTKSKGHADVFNQIFQVVINNGAYAKSHIDALEENEEKTTTALSGKARKHYIAKADADVDTLTTSGDRFFVINATNLPTGYSHGYLDVDYFDGSDFEPSNLGVESIVKQTFRPYNEDKVYIRTYNSRTSEFTDWEKMMTVADAYTHPKSGVTVGTYRSVTVDANGHVTAGSNPTLPIASGGTGATTAAKALINLGLTATANELNYVDGVTSAIQTQLNSKYSFNVPTDEIPENADLDTYIIPGEYYSPNATTSKTIVNTPCTTTGFKLRVEYISYTGHIRQTIYSISSNGEWFRTSSNGGTSYPGNWKKVINDSDVIPIEKGGTGAITKAAALTNLGLTATATELNYCDGVTSAIQTQLNSRPVASSGSFTLGYSTYTIISGTYYKIGKLVIVRGTGTPSVTVPVSTTLSGLPFSVAYTTQSFFRIEQGTNGLKDDSNIIVPTATGIVINGSLTKSMPTNFMGIYLTDD